MADDGLSLLFRLRAQNQASPVVHQVQSDVAKLRQSVGSDFNSLQQVSTTALTKISQSITGVAGQAPVLGSALQKINDAARSFGSETAKAAPAAQKLKGEIDGLAKISGKSSSELTTFVKSFAKLEDSSAKSAASIKFFGGQVDALSGNVTPRFIPQLEALSSEMTEVGVAGTSTAASLAAIAAPIGIAAVAIGAAAVGVVKLSEALFDLAKIAGDTQGKLFDLSQQTGVSVETLSALEELAKTTGGSIESIAQSLVVFQGNIEAAQDPTSKQAEIFKQLGVETENTEDALRQTLAAIAKMPEGFRQTNEAAELFGRRGGKQFLAILKESHGDIDATIRELQSMGLANSENAKKADEFNDQLVHLNTQLTALQVTLGNVVIPVVLKVGAIIDKTVKDNKEGIEALGFAVRFVSFAIGSGLVGAVKTLDAVWKFHKPGIEFIVDMYERLAAAMQLISGTVPNITGNEIGPVNLPGGSNTDSLRDLQGLLQKAAATDQAKQELQKALAKFDLQNIFGDKKKAKETDAEKEIRLAAEATDDFIRSLDKEIATLKLENTAFLQRREVFRDEQVALELTSKGYDKLTQAQKLSILEKARDVAATERANSANQTFQNFLKEQQDAINKSLGLTDEFTEEMNGLALSLGRFGVKLDDNQRAEAAWNVILKISLDHLRDINKEIDDLISSSEQIKFPELPEGTFPSLDKLNLQAPAIPSESMSLLIDQAVKAQGAFEGLGLAISSSLNLGTDAASAITDTLTTAFNGLAQAIGNAVEAWVLFGNSGGSFRKFTAEVIASIAKMAAIQAIFELAQGLAMSALTWFTGNPKYAASAGFHYASAAAYGVIAGAAAGVGRTVAGGIFQQGSTSGGGGSSTANGSGQLSPLTLNRNQVVRHEHVLVIRSNDSHIVDTVANDWSSGGKIRELVLNDGLT